MYWQKKLRAPAVVILFLAGAPSVRAEVLSGTVIDPQQRVIVGADVTLTCDHTITSRKTDRQGSFTFAAPDFPSHCRLRAASRGFAPIEVTIEHKRVVTLQLQLAAMHEAVDTQGESVMSRAPLASVTLSSKDLQGVSDNGEDLISYAKRQAGIQSDADHLYVDGLPADHPPPADQVQSITINSDPMSAEYSDAGETHIDIITRRPERKFALSSGGVSLGSKVHDGLDPRLTSESNTVSLGLVGPVPFLPLAFTSDAHLREGRREQPIEAVVPPLAGISTSALDSSQARDSSLLLGLGADYARRDTLRVNATLYDEEIRHTNLDVSGLTLPSAGLRQQLGAREFRLAFSKTGEMYVYRGGFTSDWSNADLIANSDALGVSVLGAFVAGGAPNTDQSAQSTKWTVKNVVDFSAGKHFGSAGISVTRADDVRAVTPNSEGTIIFASLDDYVASATTGAPTGTALVTRGQGDVHYISYIAAPFVQEEILSRKRLSVTAGLRADYQTAGGVLASPRLSTVGVMRGFVIRSGGGRFVRNWTNDPFLQVMERDGFHMQRFLITNTSLSDLASGKLVMEPNLVSKLGPGLAMRRDWVCWYSLEHPFKKFTPGVEYTWDDGSRLLGSERMSGPSGWTDILQSNRTMRKQQVHLRTQYQIGRQTLIAHYRWTRSLDNTDGPFSFPARQNDLGAEWAPSTGIPHHDLTVVGNLRLRGGVAMSLIESWRGPAPFNITTGLDPENDGLFTDRGGLPRNSGVGPAYHDLSLFAHRRTRVPRLGAESKRNLYVNAGIQGDNLLGDRNYTVLGSVLGSPLFDKPLAALPARTLRFCFNVGQ